MNDMEPTIGELAVELRTRFGHQDVLLGEIKENVVKTNGRVTVLETDRAIQAALARSRRWLLDTVIAVVASAALILAAAHYL